MGKIYVGQNKLTITCTVSQDITAATCLIKYIKPLTGTTGSWTGTIQTAATGVFYYNIASTAILDEAGTWILWGHVTFSDTKVAAGEPVNVVVYAEGR